MLILFFWSGLIDAEGSFILIIAKSKSDKLGWSIRPKFSIELHIKDIKILYQLQKYLGGIGKLYAYHNRAIYTINYVKELNKLFAHFESFPLLTQKAADFILFKQAITIMSYKAHLTIKGLNDIVNIKASMNLPLSNMLKENFKAYMPVGRPLIGSNNALDPSWIAGFVTGEGNFYVAIAKNASKRGYRVQLRFIITQHERDEKLMLMIISFIGSGNIYKYPSKPAVAIEIRNFSYITNKIIPLFDQYLIQGIKFLDYLDWCKVHNLNERSSLKKMHLTSEGLNGIKSLKAGVNKDRDFTLNK